MAAIRKSCSCIHRTSAGMSGNQFTNLQQNQNTAFVSKVSISLPTSLNSHLAHSSLFYKLGKGAAQITAPLSGSTPRDQHRNPAKHSCLQDLCGRNFLVSLKQGGRGWKNKRKAQWKNKEKAKQEQCHKCTFFPYDTLNRSQLHQSGTRRKTPERNLGKLASFPSTKNGTQVPHSVAQEQNTSLEFCIVWFAEQLTFQDFLKIIMTSAAQGMAFP